MFLKSFGNMLGHFWNILENVENCFGTCWEHVWDDWGRFVGKKYMIRFAN